MSDKKRKHQFYLFGSWFTAEFERNIIEVLLTWGFLVLSQASVSNASGLMGKGWRGTLIRMPCPRSWYPVRLQLIPAWQASPRLHAGDTREFLDISCPEKL